jgi:hypothetical protein
MALQGETYVESAKSRPAVTEAQLQEGGPPQSVIEFRESFLLRAGFSSRRKPNMKKNLGSADRILRLLAGLAMISCAAVAPMALLFRLTAFGATGVYLLVTASLGTCGGYALMGKSTCSTRASR